MTCILQKDIQRQNHAQDPRPQAHSQTLTHMSLRGLCKVVKPSYSEQLLFSPFQRAPLSFLALTHTDLHSKTHPNLAEWSRDLKTRKPSSE